MKTKPYWIKERHNPQLGVYYVGCGQMTARDAKRHESPIYGDNIMHEYRSRADYAAKLEELQKRGEKVHHDPTN